MLITWSFFLKMMVSSRFLEWLVAAKQVFVCFSMTVPSVEYLCSAFVSIHLVEFEFCTKHTSIISCHCLTLHFSVLIVSLIHLHKLVQFFSSIEEISCLNDQLRQIKNSIRGAQWLFPTLEISWFYEQGKASLSAVDAFSPISQQNGI